MNTLLSGSPIIQDGKLVGAVTHVILHASNAMPKAAFYIFPKIDCKKLNITDDKKFDRDLLHATNILIVPGSGFDWREPDHFRIVMLPEVSVLKTAIQDLGKFMDSYIQK